MAGLPAEPYPSRRSGLDYLGSNSCTLFINYLDINNIDKTQNYVKIAFFFHFFFFFLFHVYMFTDCSLYRYVIVILVKVVRKSGNGISNLEWGCADLEWNIYQG